MTTIRPDAGKAGTAEVNFLCQRCHQPLKLDQSFNNLDPPMLADLTAPVSSTSHNSDDTVDLIQQAVGSDQEISPRRQYHVPPIRCVSLEDGGNGFTLLGETSAGSMENLSLRMKGFVSERVNKPGFKAMSRPSLAKLHPHIACVRIDRSLNTLTINFQKNPQVTSYLFDIMSGQSEVDHPLCEECTDGLLDQLDQQLKITEDDCRDYREFLESLGTDEEVLDEASLDVELQQLQAEQQALQQQLENVESQRAQVRAEIAEEKRLAEKLKEDEEKVYYKQYNEYKKQLLELEDEQKSVDNQLRYAQTQLDRLKKTNIFNATFHIWHSGHFGTINNFRLGRLPSVAVEWNEINAAWGQTVLLLHSLARKMNLTFQRYRLVPYGNHSFIESLSDKSKDLPLYGSGGIRFLRDTKFDQAMVAFLDCLQQFKEEVEKGDSGFCLPYKMDRGKIEDTSTGTAYSIKMQFNSEEQWTKALKFMLTNLKWGLAWVASQFVDS